MRRGLQKQEQRGLTKEFAGELKGEEGASESKRNAQHERMKGNSKNNHKN